MICNEIRIRDFRNIENADLQFSDGVNILSGANAQGKTNLLEAIGYIAIGKSFRTAHDDDLIRFGQETAEISMDFSDSQRKQNLTVRLMKGKRRRLVQNGVNVKKISDVVGAFRTVLFCPEHLSLVKEGPAERRNFLDVAISQLYPMYLKSLQRYHQILKERNQLIRDYEKNPQNFRDTAEFWSLQLAREAAILSKYRFRYLEQLKGHVRECFSEMTDGRETPDLIYVGSSGQDPDEYDDIAKTEAKYVELLTGRQEREIGAGSTLWGIHKDDIEIRLNEKSARLFASQGQQRSIALSMKLGEGEVCKEVCSELPCFLLDDVFSELDSGRREYLSSKIQGKQVIITSCETEKLPCGKWISVRDGIYKEEGCIST